VAKKRLTIFLSIITISLFSILSIPETFAQTDIEQSNQTTLTGNQLNDPIAQDILKKIEQTKKWIGDFKLDHCGEHFQN